MYFYYWFDPPRFSDLPPALRFNGNGLLSNELTCFWYIHAFPKGGLISESFSLWLKSPKRVPNHSSEHFFYLTKFLRLSYLYQSKCLISLFIKWLILFALSCEKIEEIKAAYHFVSFYFFIDLGRLRIRLVFINNLML